MTGLWQVLLLLAPLLGFAFLTTRGQSISDRIHSRKEKP